MNLREASQQALEALESVEWYGAGSGWMVDAGAIEGAITALRTALAEDAMQRLTDIQQEMERSIDSLKAALVEPTVPSDCADSHQPGCDRCRSPLWCGDKCSVCGAVYANK